MFNRISIIGLGLIGGSIAKAVRHYLPSTHILGMDTSSIITKQAQNLGIIHTACTTMEEAMDTSLVIICTPLMAYPSIATSIKPYLKPGIIITDTGSVKQCTIDDLAELGDYFVPAHPIAGKSQGGLAAAETDLFYERITVLTPTPSTPKTSLRTVETFWETLQAQIVHMSPDEHDRHYAQLSHLPQALIYCENYYLIEQKIYATYQKHPHLRLASSPISIWHDIFLKNRKYLLPLLENCLKELHTLTIKNIQNAKNLRAMVKPQAVNIDPTHPLPELAFIVASLLTQNASDNLDYAGAGFLDSTACLTQYENQPLPSVHNIRYFAKIIEELIICLSQQDSGRLKLFLQAATRRN